MRSRCALLAVASAVLCVAPPTAAQEPSPVRLTTALVDAPEAVTLDFAWRFQPGDEPRAADPALDDSGWRPVRPALYAEDLPGGWPGSGWFRRHVRFDRDLRGNELALRVEAPGVAEVFVDGVQVLGVAARTAPEQGYPRREAAVFTVPDRDETVIAVRYVLPLASAEKAAGRGYVLHLARPGRLPAGPPRLLAAAQGAIVALPLFLALLHLAFYAFTPRARENLWYALQAFAFSALILRDDASALGFSEPAAAALVRVTAPTPLAAIFFGLLTYQEIRLGRLSRSAPWFAGIGAALAAGGYVFPSWVRSAWVVYYAAMLVDVVRVERRGATVRREGVRFFTTSFAVFGVFVVLQALVNYGLLPSTGAMSSIYVLGILSSAVGMSLFLARTFGQARLVEAENARKTQELEEARALQLSMLPRALPEVAGLDVAAATFTATEVGGDVYDFRVAPDGSLLVGFGDATGHGLASGLVVTAAKAFFGTVSTDARLVDSLAACDRVLRGMRLGNLSMCLVLARLTPRSAAVACAAMPPVLVHRAASGAVEELGEGGRPLGGGAGRLPGRWTERTTELAAGDTLLFASDGFPELADPAGTPLGYPGAAETLRRAAAGRTAREVLDGLERAVAAWRGTRPQDDDITFVIVRVTA